MSIELTKAEPFAAPLVERLSVRLLVDSFYDRFIDDASHPMVAIEHVRHIPGHERSTFAGEWGLSLHLESDQAGGKSQYLLDFGYTPEVLIRNFALLDLDPGRIDGLILSHGHRDHYGGLEGFVSHYRARMRSRFAALRRRRGQFSREMDQAARRRPGVLGYARPQGARSRQCGHGVLRGAACAAGRLHDRAHPPPIL